MSLGPHATFIWLSYGAVGVVVAALIAGLLAEGWRLERDISDLEARGVRRAAGGDAGTGDGTGDGTGLEDNTA